MISTTLKLWRHLFTVAFLGLVFSCVEPIKIETGEYENALVIEGTVTNELEYQEVKLSRTYELEENGPSLESGAQVQVVGNSNVYAYEEVEPGSYVSIQPFQAVTGESYQLEVTTSNGIKYVSEQEELKPAPGISNLYAERLEYKNEEGVAILLDVDGGEENSGYYLYRFEETYKIVSPFDFDRDLVYRNGEFIEVPKTREEETCYVTEESQEVLLANTNAQSTGDLNELLIKFINKENYRTAHRYSILVKQYSISADAYSYYETLKDFSDSESLFAQTQLGLINGNLSPVNDGNEKVIGFFTVANVSSQRIFFDFDDFYSKKEFVPNSHISICDLFTALSETPAEIEALAGQLERGSIKYTGMEVLSYVFVNARCVDCTYFGTNEVPDFWED